MIEDMKSSIKDVPRPIANDIWHDFLSWLTAFSNSRDFHRITSIPFIKTKFKERLDAAVSSILEEEERAIALDKAGSDLSAAIRRLTALEALVKDKDPSTIPPNLAADHETAQNEVHRLNELVEVLDDSDILPPSSEAGADDTAPAPPIDAPAPLGDIDPSAAPVLPPRAPAPWSEKNYENFYDRTALSFPAVSGKFPISDLLVTMDDPIDSKILMPRSLEVYTVDELRSATAANLRPWLNRYEDPLEPCKSWSPDTFSQVYSRDCFFFFIARVAQRDAQWRDKKLDKLRAALSSRWSVPVELERIPPRHDWMLCSIPHVPKEGDPTFEILSAALIRLSDGNASYVVRHIAPLSTLRDLDIHVKGSIADPSSVYNQLRKKQLEYESSGAFLGWRVIGVRPGKAVSRYRASFLLDSNRVSWPWTHSWNHPHGSIPPSHNLLDFMPAWSATKPYACQSCYNSDHFTMECPLAHIRLGGTLIVSPTSLSLMLRKKAAERLVIVDKSLIPPPVSGKSSHPAENLLNLSPIPLESPARPLHPDVSRAVDLAFKFLSLKLHSILPSLRGLTLELVRELCTLHKGDVHMVVANLHSRGFNTPWNPAILEPEWATFQISNAIPGSASVSAMSVIAPPRYFKQVQFIQDILSLIPMPPSVSSAPPLNIPEIVVSCHGDLQSIMRRLEIAHNIPVPPYTADSLTSQFSTWLAKPLLGNSAPLDTTPGPSPEFPVTHGNMPVKPPAALPQAPAAPMLPEESITIVSPHDPPASLAAAQPATPASRPDPLGMALATPIF